MEFKRASENPRRVSPEWMETFRKGGADRAALFRKFVECHRDVAQVELSMMRDRVATQKRGVEMGYLTRKELIDLHGSPELAEAIMKNKVERGEYRGAPGYGNGLMTHAGL